MDHSTTINNPYFPAVPGTIWTYNSTAVDDETGEVTKQVTPWKC